ncbi:hypothetical protein DFH09DRAFT_1180608 [Mycena vulgaris]|nr:hypothetical protein DFH09DRAFT_1180608 [Mycena vulgaris]
MDLGLTESPVHTPSSSPLLLFLPSLVCSNVCLTFLSLRFLHSIYVYLRPHPHRHRPSLPPVPSIHTRFPALPSCSIHPSNPFLRPSSPFVRPLLPSFVRPLLPSVVPAPRPALFPSARPSFPHARPFLPLPSLPFFPSLYFFLLNGLRSTSTSTPSFSFPCRCHPPPRPSAFVISANPPPRSCAFFLVLLRTFEKTKTHSLTPPRARYRSLICLLTPLRPRPIPRVNPPGALHRAVQPRLPLQVPPPAVGNASSGV